MSQTLAKDVSRRSFVKGGALTGLALAGSGVLFGCTEKKDEPTPEPTKVEEKLVWSHCHVNCGGACPLLLHVVDDEIVSVDSDTSGSSEFGGFQARACLRGRSIRRWINGADRLNYPMKRVEGTKRGEGKYEQITWDEALDLIASEFKRIVSTYGNEAIFIQECSGVEQNVMQNGPFFRLFNLLGGETKRYGSYSSGAISGGGIPYTYGSSWGGRSFHCLADNELVVLFGNAPCDTRMAGDGAGYDLNVMREKKNLKIIVIDPRRSELATNQEVEWIPIAPGTDGALVAGIAHELIASNLVDVEFLHKYCIGYDEETMPAGAPENASYKSYVMGLGYDMVEKTPAWAASITKIPEARIIKLAHEIGEAKPCYIAQGYGPQRRTNGDMASRSLMLLPQLVGQVGIPHTNSGARESNSGYYVGSIPQGTNPVKPIFPNFMWPEAIDHGHLFTDLNAGVQNGTALKSDIKMLVNYGNNMMSNQNSDINATTDILKDETKCEFIIQYDVVWSDSCNWADLVLPDLTPQETFSLSSQGECNDTKAVWFGTPATTAKFERREVYEVCGELAKRLDVWDEYSDGGKTREDWCRYVYENWAKKYPAAPQTWDEGVAMGIYKAESEYTDGGTLAFITDPVANPLKTPSGKIEIYSERLANIAKTWELPENDVVLPIPGYARGVENYEDTTSEYPLCFVGYHTKAHTHSSYSNNEIIQNACRHNAWINPIDADARGIKTGDTVRVKSPHGELQIEACVTNRIMPGCVAISQGMWHKADMQGDRIDYGGCTNTISSRHATPVAKAVGCHSAIIQVTKA